MKFNNHFLYYLKKNNLLFISSLIIIILFSLYINSQFKEGNENIESEETNESLNIKINEEKEKLLTDEEKGNDKKITLDAFFSGDDGNRKKGIYNQIIAYKIQLDNLRSSEEEIKSDFKENEHMTAIEINKFILSLTDKITDCNYFNKLSKIIGLNISMGEELEEGGVGMTTGINIFSK